MEKIFSIKHLVKEHLKIEDRRFLEDNSFFSNHDAIAYFVFLGINPEDLENKTVLDLGSGKKELFSKQVSVLEKVGKLAQGCKIFSLNPKLKGKWARVNTQRNFLGLFKDPNWQKKSLAGRAQELPFSENSFDIITCHLSIPLYLPISKEEHLLTSSELMRVLKSDGKVYIYPVYNKQGIILPSVSRFIEVAKDIGFKCEQNEVGAFVLSKLKEKTNP